MSLLRHVRPVPPLFPQQNAHEKLCVAAGGWQVAHRIIASSGTRRNGMTGWRFNRMVGVRLVECAVPHRVRTEVRSMAVERRRHADASDDDLLRWSGLGDRDAFDQIVVRYGPYALRMASRLTGNAEAAEDLVQDAFVRAWSHAREFDGSRARFTTWLYRIIVNLSIDLSRKRQPEPLPDEFDMVDEGPSAENRLEAAQQRHALVAALQAVPSRQRAAMTLVYDEGLSGAEAARRMGLSAKAVERLLARGRTFLRDRLGRDGSVEGGRNP
ncbi:sigma-70 family RNA polymerase sigma factor [Acetobacter sp. DsW_063]|uniref:sigma-70 family RNA polymerase sigma factor n=1 Tax=Acetobacter sp. DsW_063 TaxID=1514894 RepID=UPI001E2A85ED|nr:sigma-70 family RNA polymerase sigma factor [Acetobacter sp. DsW_063]